MCVGDLTISASDNCSNPEAKTQGHSKSTSFALEQLCEIYSDNFSHHLQENGTGKLQQVLCPNEINEWHSGSKGINVKINCKLEDWKIILICTGVGLMIIFAYKVMKMRKQRQVWETAINQNVAANSTIPTISINVTNTLPPPSYIDLNHSWTSNSINTKNETNYAVNSEDKPPTYEEFLQSNR